MTYRDLQDAVEKVLTPNKLGYTAFMDCDGDCRGTNCICKIRAGETVHSEECEVGALIDVFNHCKSLLILDAKSMSRHMEKKIIDNLRTNIQVQRIDFNRFQVKSGVLKTSEEHDEPILDFTVHI
jgi:hypothetical protein